jgi:hypothetical protein
MGSAAPTASCDLQGQAPAQDAAPPRPMVAALRAWISARSTHCSARRKHGARGPGYSCKCWT